MRVYALGPCRVSGGTFWLVEGGPPNAGIVWTIGGTGGGSLTPMSDSTNASGTAMALWNGAGATVDGTLTVGVSVYA